jgi:hypothetical protein
MRRANAKHWRVRTEANNRRPDPWEPRARPARVQREAPYLRLERKRSFRSKELGQFPRPNNQRPDRALERPRHESVRARDV